MAEKNSQLRSLKPARLASWASPEGITSQAILIEMTNEPIKIGSGRNNLLQNFIHVIHFT
eukprot:4644644-Amphidinium_carterae.1